jgi:hypothetical protein
MAQNRARPVRQHGGHPAPVLGQETMADRVDAAVDGAEPPELPSMHDCAAIQAEL